MITKPPRADVTRARNIAAQAERERRSLSASERRFCRAVLDASKAAQLQADTAHLLGDGTDVGGGGTLSNAIMAAGFNRLERPVVTVGWRAAIGATSQYFDGDIGDANPFLSSAPALGADSRYLFTRFPVVGVGPDVTSASSFRQKSRTLPAPADVTRAIDAVSTKPAVVTVTEVVNEPLHQIAVIEDSIPNVLIERPEFRSFVDMDLQIAWAEGADLHVVSAIGDANPAPVSGGDNILEQLYFGVEQVQSEGYTPNLAALSPADALSLALAQLPDGVTYIGDPQTPVPVVVCKGLDDGAGLVMDTRGAGVMYLSPLTLAVFEESAGSTNTSTVRLEANGVFVVQRAGAICSLNAGS